MGNPKQDDDDAAAAAALVMMMTPMMERIGSRFSRKFNSYSCFCSSSETRGWWHSVSSSSQQTHRNHRHELLVV